jgi:hypothetical protein
MITLSWKLHKVLDTDYYYTFHDNKFWCVKAEYVKEGVVTANDFVFQVTTRKMEGRTKFKLVERLSHLFPEIPLQQIKDTLHYDKDAHFQNINT